MALLDFLFSSPDPPPAPDYKGAAEATAEGGLEASRFATQANRFDQYTPLGSQTWTNLGTEQFDQSGYDAAMEAYNTAIYGGGSGVSQEEFLEGKWTGDLKTAAAAAASPSATMPDRADFTTTLDQDKWRSDVNLSPEVQSLFDKGLMMQEISADIGLQAGGQIEDIFADPFKLDDFALEEFSLGDFEGYREDVYDAMMERLETDISKDWDSRNAELYAGGIGRGTEAYGWEQTQRDRMLNDARLQSYIGATDQALKERQQGVNEWESRNQTSLADRQQSVKEALLARQTPLNEYNAWRTGSQVDLPQFQPGGLQQTTAGPDYLNASIEGGQYDLAGYNADVMGRNAMMSGLFGLGAGGLAGGYF